MKAENMDALLKKIKLLVILATFFTGALVAIVCLAYMHGMLKEQQDRRLHANLLIDAGIIEQYIARARESGMQIVSRTAVRKELENYGDGLVGLTALREFTIPKLGDALNAAGNVVAMRRFDAKGAPVAEVVKKTDGIPGLAPNMPAENHVSFSAGGNVQRVSDPMQRQGKAFFTVTTPIRNSRNEPLGTDVIVVNFDDLLRQLAEKQTEAVSRMLYFKGSNAFYDLNKGEFKAGNAEDIPLSVRLRLKSLSPAKNSHGYLKATTLSGEKMLFGGIALSNADWIVVCGFSEKRAYQPVYAILRDISLLMLFIVLLSAYLTARLLKPFTGNIIVKVGRLEEEIESRIADSRAINDRLLQEIAERKEMEQILRKSEKRLKEAEKIAHLGHWELDLKTDALYWSEEIYRIFGLPAVQGSLTMNDFEAMIHPEDRDGVVRAYMHSVEKNLPYSIVHRIIRPDGEVRYVHEQGVNACDETGKVLKSFGTVLDVTEPKIAEDLKIEVEKKALELQKKESLQNMAGAIAHHLNNGMTAIIGGIEMAVAESKGEKHSKWLDMAFDSAVRASQMGQLLLQYLGQYMVKFAPVSLEEFWRDFQRAAVGTVPDNITVKYEIAENLPVVRGNVALLTTLFKNIIDNSREAIDKETGVIAISCRSRYYPAGDIENEFSDANAQEISAGDYVLISITDTGGGIDSDHLRTIFDPFFSTKFTGRGLGLAVAEGIVKTHRGLIKIESERGRGTTVKILLRVN